MNTNRAMLIAIPVIFVVVLAMTFLLHVFSSSVFIVVVVVMYVVVSLFNRRKFKRQAEAPQSKTK